MPKGLNIITQPIKNRRSQGLSNDNDLSFSRMGAPIFNRPLLAGRSDPGILNMLAFRSAYAIRYVQGLEYNNGAD